MKCGNSVCTVRSEGARANHQVPPHFFKHLKDCPEYLKLFKKFTEASASKSAWLKWERVYNQFCGVPSRDEVVSPLLESTTQQDLSSLDKEGAGFGYGSEGDEAHTISGDNLPLPKLDAVKIVGTSKFLRQICDAKQGITTGSDSDLNVSSSSEGDTFCLPDFLS